MHLFKKLGCVFGVLSFGAAMSAEYIHIQNSPVYDFFHVNQNLIIMPPLEDSIPAPMSYALAYDVARIQKRILKVVDNNKLIDVDTLTINQVDEIKFIVNQELPDIKSKFAYVVNNELNPEQKKALLSYLHSCKKELNAHMRKIKVAAVTQGYFNSLKKKAQKLFNLDVNESDDQTFIVQKELQGIAVSVLDQLLKTVEQQ